MGLDLHLTMWNVRRSNMAVNTWLPSSLVPCLCPELFVLLPFLVLGPSVTSPSNIWMASNNVTMFTKRAGHCSVLYIYTILYMIVTYILMFARDFYNCTHVCSNNRALMYSLPTNSLCAGVVILKSSTHTSHTCPIHSGHQSLCLFTHVDTIHCSLWAAKQGKSERAIAMKWHCINLCTNIIHTSNWGLAVLITLDENMVMVNYMFKYCRNLTSGILTGNDWNMAKQRFFIW